MNNISVGNYKKVYSTFEDGQLAKSIYLNLMPGMKEILTLGEMRMGNKDSDVYKYFKKVVMDQFYTKMLTIFEALEKEGILVKCPCNTTIRQGYKPCNKCNGSGYCNSEDFDAFVEDGRNNNPSQFQPIGLCQDSLETDDNQETP